MNHQIRLENMFSHPTISNLFCGMLPNTERKQENQDSDIEILPNSTPKKKSRKNSIREAYDPEEKQEILEPNQEDNKEQSEPR